MISMIKRTHLVCFILSLFLTSSLFSAPRLDIKFSIPKERDKIDFTVTNLEKEPVICKYFQAKITYADDKTKKIVGIYNVKSDSFSMDPNKKVRFDIGKNFSLELKKKIKKSYIFKMDTTITMSCAVLTKQGTEPITNGFYEKKLKIDIQNKKCRLPDGNLGNNYLLVNCEDPNNIYTLSIYSVKTGTKDSTVPGVLSSYSIHSNFFSVLEFGDVKSVSSLFSPLPLKIKIYAIGQTTPLKEISLTTLLMFTVSGFSSDEKYFYVNIYDSKAFKTIIIDLKNGSEVGRFDGWVLDSQNNGNLLLIARTKIYDNNILNENNYVDEISVFSPEKNKSIFKLNGVFSTAFGISGDGKSVGIVEKDGFIKLYNISSGEKMYAIKSNGLNIKRLYLNGDGRRVVTMNYGGDDIYYWNIDKSTTKKVMTSGDKVLLSRDLNYFIIQSKSSVLFLNPRDDKEYLYSNIPLSYFIGITYDNSKFIYFRDDINAIEIKEIVSSKVVKSINSSTDSFFITNDGKYIVKAKTMGKDVVLIEILY